MPNGAHPRPAPASSRATTTHRQLTRQLEKALRKSNGVRDARRLLIQSGLTEDQVWAIELPIRRRIRSERATPPSDHDRPRNPTGAHR
jgi:hypothetical protein